MGEIADASAQREEHAGKDRHLHRTTASTSAAASTQSLDTCSRRAVTKAFMLRSEGRGVPLGAWKCLCGALEGLGVLLGCSGGLVAAKFVKCPKSYYTEQFEKYGYIRDKIRYDV